MCSVLITSFEMVKHIQKPRRGSQRATLWAIVNQQNQKRRYAGKKSLLFQRKKGLRTRRQLRYLETLSRQRALPQRATSPQVPAFS